VHHIDYRFTTNRHHTHRRPQPMKHRNSSPTRRVHLPGLRPTLAGYFLLVFCSLFITLTAHAANQTIGNPQAVSVYGDIPDLGGIRTVKVSGHEIRALPMRVGNLDILSPFTSSLSSLGASATQVNTSYLPKGTPK